MKMRHFFQQAFRIVGVEHESAVVGMQEAFADGVVEEAQQGS